jgi:SHS2 domain-containing protein
MYELFEHTADLGLRVQAADLNQLFADAAQALFAAIVTDLTTVRLVERHRFAIEEAELDYLLVDWLSELLYRFATEHRLFAAFAPRVGPHGLTAEARGEPLDPSRHELGHEVKGITYHGLMVTRLGDGWRAEVIVDI